MRPWRAATIGGLSVTSPSDWTLVDYWGLWDSDAVSLDSTAVPMFELTNFDAGLSTPVCDAAPGDTTRLPADGVAIFAVVGNDGRQAGDRCGGSIADASVGTVRVLDRVPYQVVLAIGPAVTEKDQAVAHEIFRSIRWTGPVAPYARGHEPRYILDGSRDGSTWWLLEAHPSASNVQLSVIEFVRYGESGSDEGSDFQVPSPNTIEGNGWFGAVTEEASKVDFYRERGGPPIEGRVVDLPPSLPFAFDAWWFGSDLRQNWDGEAVAVGHDGTILGSTLPPLVQSMQVGTLRTSGARWRVKDSRSADGYDAHACVEPSSAPTSPPCARPLGGGLSVQTFSEPVPASFLSVDVSSDIRLEIRMHDGTTLQPVRFPAWNGAAVAVFVLEGTGSGRLIYHYSDNGAEHVYKGPAVGWPAHG